MNLQDAFINHIRTNNIEVEITCTNGDPISGTIRGFDPNVIVLDVYDTEEERPREAIIYKAQIVHIVPDQPIDLFNGSTGSEEAEPQ
ncbi:MAG: RNA chaperone Hfq [Oscillospiraceae bacterium]